MSYRVQHGLLDHWNEFLKLVVLSKSGFAHTAGFHERDIPDEHEKGVWPLCLDICSKLVQTHDQWDMLIENAQNQQLPHSSL